MFTGHYSLTHRHICKNYLIPNGPYATIWDLTHPYFQCGRVPPGRKAPTKISQVTILKSFLILGAKNIQIWIQKRSGGSVTANSVTSRQQQPPPQYSMTPMQQQYQQGQGAPHQYQGYNVDHRLQEQGQYRGQYQGRVQSRPFDQQEGVWEKYCSLETTTIWIRSLWIWF